jgi:hypothetical protein
MQAVPFLLGLAIRSRGDVGREDSGGALRAPRDGHQETAGAGVTVVEGVAKLPGHEETLVMSPTLPRGISYSTSSRRTLTIRLDHRQLEDIAYAKRVEPQS